MPSNNEQLFTNTVKDPGEELAVLPVTRRDMGDLEIQAYAAGYNSAARLFKSIVDHWERAIEFHSHCQCACCRTLRDVAHGRFGDMEILSHTHIHVRH